MIVETTAMNLTDLWMLRDLPERIKSTAWSMIKNGSILTDIKQVTDARLMIRGREYTNVSAPHWVPLNAVLQNFKQTPNDWAEDTYQFGDFLDIPIRILKAERAEGREPEKLFDDQVEQYLMGCSYDLNTKFFRNSHGGSPSQYQIIDPNSFVGLLPRFRDAITNGTKSKYRINPECNVNAGGLDLSPTGITPGNASTMIRFINSALYSLGEEMGDGCVAHASENLISAIEDGIRRLGAGGGFDMAKDAFGRRVAMYRNMPIKSAGRQAPDANQVQAQVLPITETVDGMNDTGGTYTSLVIEKTGEKDFYMTKAEELQPSDPRKLENGIEMRVVVTNAYGLVMGNRRCLARVFGIKIA